MNDDEEDGSPLEMKKLKILGYIFQNAVTNS